MRSRAAFSRAAPAAATLVLLLSLAACGDTDTSPFGDAASSSAPGSSSAASSTTAPPTTTTTTTTSAPTTSIPTTTTTSTIPEPLLFLPDGLGIVDFGASPDDAVAIVGAYLGFAPTDDSGWGPAWGDYGACPGNEYRQVEFDGLVLQFTDADIFRPAGTRHFFAWSYNGTPPSASPGPLGVGTSVAALQGLYPAVTLFGDDPIFGSTFRVDGPGGEQLWGRLTGTAPGDTILFLTGGWGCGE